MFLIKNTELFVIVQICLKSKFTKIVMAAWNHKRHQVT